MTVEPYSTIDTFISGEELSKAEDFAKEKRTSVLVVFFDDMQGSTILKQKMTEQADEEAFQQLRREHDQIITDILKRNNVGEIIKSTGDGVLAVFSEPSTAVERTLEIQDVFKNHPLIKVRMGIDMGQVRVERAGGIQNDLFGRHVDWAARVTSMADAGHILVTRSVFIDAFGWIPKSEVSWKEFGFFRKKEGEQPLELFEPYRPQLTDPMETPSGKKISDTKSIQQDISKIMILGSTCLCLIIITLGVVLSVIQGILPISLLSIISGIGILGSLYGLGALLYKLNVIVTGRSIASEPL